MSFRSIIKRRSSWLRSFDVHGVFDCSRSLCDTPLVMSSLGRSSACSLIPWDEWDFAGDALEALFVVGIVLGLVVVAPDVNIRALVAGEISASVRLTKGTLHSDNNFLANLLSWRLRDSGST